MDVQGEGGVVHLCARVSAERCISAGELIGKGLSACRTGFVV